MERRSGVIVSRKAGGTEIKREEQGKETQVKNAGVQRGQKDLYSTLAPAPGTSALHIQIPDQSQAPADEWRDNTSGSSEQFGVHVDLDECMAHDAKQCNWS